MNIEQHIEEIISPALLHKGYRVVRIQFQGSKRKTLQIMIERTDNENVSVDDCETVSRTSSVLLDVEDPIHEPYILEVTSPGLDRPLVKKEDFERFAGAKIKIELKTPHEGSRKFQGLLLGVDEDMVKLELEPQKEIVNL